MQKYTGTGIKEEIIDNFNDYKEILKSLICCICLDIVSRPWECSICESYYCQECWQIMKISDKKCVLHCDSEVRVANSSVRAILSNLLINCESCGKMQIEYNIYVKHIDACMYNKKISTIEELSKVVKDKQYKVDELMAKIENIKLNESSGFGNSVPKNGIKLNEFNNVTTQTNVNTMNADQIRKKLLTFDLSANKKMELYNSIVDGKLEDFKDLILNKKYPLFEEISAHKYYWTSLHYAMHYGKKDLIFFILELVNNKKAMDYVMKLQSNDGRCPMLCLLRSNSLNLESKKNYVELILQKYNFAVSDELRIELRNRDMDDLLRAYR